jgi:hypothetical protein
MTILVRLERWKEQGAISPQQHAHWASLTREDPFSLFLELNVLLYAGVLAFVAGLGWTVTTWSHQLGDVLVLTILTAILAACFWYCFSRAPAWSPAATPAPESRLRLRALSRQPGVVRRTRLSGEPLPRALWTMGSLSLGDRRLLFLPRLSFRQSFCAGPDAPGGSVDWCGMVYSTLACPWPGRSSPRLYRRAPIGKRQALDQRRLRRTRPGITPVHNANPATKQSRLPLRWGSFGRRRCRRRLLKGTHPCCVPLLYIYRCVIMQRCHARDHQGPRQERTGAT